MKDVRKSKDLVKVEDYYAVLENIEVINFVLFDDYEKIKLYMMS